MASRKIIQLLLFVPLFGCTHQIDSQKEVNLLLKEKILSADSVFLTSHLGSTFDKTKGEIYPEVVINDKVNQTILTEKKALGKSDIKELIEVMLMPTDNNKKVDAAKCYNPHHAIIVIKDNAISYIDLDFGCFGLTTSEDLSEIKGYEIDKWRSIYRLFKKQGLTYEMATPKYP